MRCLARLAVVLLACTLCTVAPAPVFAQETRGSVGGRVTDPSGAILPGVTVTALNSETGGKTVAVTNTDGVYLLSFLNPGRYSVTAELSGFKQLRRDGVEIRIGDKLTLDMTLSIGQREEVVSVHADTPLLEAASASQGQVIDEQRIALPLSDGNRLRSRASRPARHGRLCQSSVRQRRHLRHRGGWNQQRTQFTLDGSPNAANGRRGPSASRCGVRVRVET